MGKPIIETQYSRENESYVNDTKKQRRFSYIKALKNSQFNQTSRPTQIRP